MAKTKFAPRNHEMSKHYITTYINQLKYAKNQLKPNFM